MVSVHRSSCLRSHSPVLFAVLSNDLPFCFWPGSCYFQLVFGCFMWKALIIPYEDIIENVWLEGEKIIFPSELLTWNWIRTGWYFKEITQWCFHVFIGPCFLFVCTTNWVMALLSCVGAAVKQLMMDYWYVITVLKIRHHFFTNSPLI